MYIYTTHEPMHATEERWCANKHRLALIRH